VNLARTLQYAAERHPGAEAVVDGEQRLTYAALHERAARLAGGLAGLGVGAGDRVAVLLKNRVETVALYWACQWLGAWFVPLNFRLGPDEVDYCIEDAGAVAVAFDAAGAGAARAVAGDGGPRLIAVAGADGGDARFEDLCAAEPDRGALDRDDGEIALMLYTSGTTGRPKGVPRSHRADRAAGMTQVIHHGLQFGDRTLGVMPLYHTMGMHSMIAMALVGGCFVVLGDWSPADALALVGDERLTSLYLAPTFYHDLLGGEACDSTDLSGVRSVGYAGSPMSPALAGRCAEAFSPRVFFNHYGSTEIYTWAIHRDQAAKPGCVGRSAINARLRLVRPESDAGPDDGVGAGEDGQVICELASDEAFAGYWQRPDADQAAIRDGWYYPGDTARLDDDGDLWIVGRLDDMIISGGENIHPVEVEDALTGHPAVAEAAVIGESDERWGERVVAYVVLAGEATQEDLDEHCRRSAALASFKRPREYRFLEELPKSSAGKVLRRQLRKESSSP
jgi:2-furoate---CoA ligase